MTIQPKKLFTDSEILDLLNNTGLVKRIHFATYHKNAFKRSDNPDKDACLTLPFADTVIPLLNYYMGYGLNFRNSKFSDGLYCYIKDEEKSAIVDNFINDYRQTVFLRDTLDLSLALDFNFEADAMNQMSYTHIGVLEHKAKEEKDARSLNELTDMMELFLNRTPYYASADYIYGMTSSRGLPQSIVAGMGSWKGRDISSNVSFIKSQNVRQATTHADKYQRLAQSEFYVSETIDLTNKSVVILDDLYQSGASVQYVAKKFKELGTKYVYGIYLVKSWTN